MRMNAWTRRVAETRTELRHHPVLRGAATAAAVAVAGQRARRTRTGVLAGLAAGLVEASVLERLAALGRDVRNAEDAALLAPILGSTGVSLGTWAAEPDFLRLVAVELTRDPVGVVELGSGASTLMMATIRRERRAAPVISIEHDRAFAQRMWTMVARAGLQDFVEIHVAPLRTTVVHGHEGVWYDREEVERCIPAQIDLLVVDGPPSTTRMARWPALEVLATRLTDQGVVLLDDGRRRDETTTARHWARRHPDLALYWHDTVKGAWRLEVTPRADGPVVRLARRGVRRLDAHPSGFRRWSVRR